MQRKPLRKAGALAHTGPRTRWTGFRPMYDFWGNELKRFYQLETLAAAMDHALATGKDKCLIASIHDALGPGAISALHFELFQEGRFQLIFRVRAMNPKKKEGVFALVVAKNHQECSLVAKNEYNNLRVLHERAPDHVVRPYRSGKLYLPDRHGRRELGREIFIYVTQWLQGFEELGVDRSLQFIVNTQRRHVFSLRETEELKGIMAETIARTYDPAQHNCMEIPEVASGDFVVRKSGGRLGLRLIACRRLLTRVSPVRLIDKILAARWPWGQLHFELAPVSAETLYQALVRARGAEEAQQWAGQYVAAAGAGKVKNRRPDYVRYFQEQLAGQ